MNEIANFKRSNFASSAVSNLSFEENRTIVQLAESIT